MAKYVGSSQERKRDLPPPKMHLPIVPQQKYEIHRKKVLNAEKSKKKLFSEFGKSCHIHSFPNFRPCKNQRKCCVPLTWYYWGSAERIGGKSSLPPSLPPSRRKTSICGMFSVLIGSVAAAGVTFTCPPTCLYRGKRTPSFFWPFRVF